MGKLIQLNKTYLHYQFIGKTNPDKPFIVFLHEGLGSIPQWKDFPKKLCEKTQLPGLVYEREGYGKSKPATPQRQDHFLLHEAVDVLPELLEKLQLSQQPHYIFGHSDGGSIALLYASSRPVGLRALVCEAPHVVLEPASTKGIKRTKTAYLNGIIKKGLDQYHRPHTDNVVLSWTDYWLQEGVKDWNMLSHLEKIETPVFFIQGDKDMFGTFRQADEIKKRVKGPYRELLLTDCGHMPHFEKQEKVLAETAAFFSDV